MFTYDLFTNKYNQCYSVTDELKPFCTKPVRSKRTPSFKRSRYFSAASSNVSEQSRNNMLYSADVS